MNLGLWDIENLLLQAYYELSQMEASLSEKYTHSPGILETRKSRSHTPQEEIYYRFYSKGKIFVKRVYPDQISLYQNEILKLKNLKKELALIRKKLHLSKKCLKALRLDPHRRALFELAAPSASADAGSAVYPENLKHPTLQGEYVRSKSEALLANIFFYHNIPYQYEKPLILNSRTLLPDFTLTGPDGNEITGSIWACSI